MKPLDLFEEVVGTRLTLGDYNTPLAIVKVVIDSGGDARDRLTGSQVMKQ